MSVIYCNVDMFTMKAQLLDEEGKNFATIDVDKVDTVLVNYCYNYKINTIHFIGMNNYINGLVESMKQYEVNTYGLNNLNFEVN